MCNPTLVVAGASAVLSYQSATEQQKLQRDQQNRQNELALKNYNTKLNNTTRQLIEKTKSRLTKIGDAEKVSRKKRATFKTNRENFTGVSYDTLLANYYDTEAGYRNRVLGNIERSKFNYLNGTLSAIENQYDAQSTYVSPVTRGYNALNSSLQFAESYYGYKAKQNRYQTNVEKYGYENYTADTDIYSDSGYQY